MRLVIWDGKMARMLPPLSFTDFPRCWWFAMALVPNGGYFDIHPSKSSPLFLLPKIVAFTAYIPSLPLSNHILESITISLRALLISRMASTLPWIILVFHTIFCKNNRYEIKAPQSLIALQHSSSCHITSESIFSTIHMDVLTTILYDSKLDIRSTYLIKCYIRTAVRYNTYWHAGRYRGNNTTPSNSSINSGYSCSVVLVCSPAIKLS